MAEIGGEIPKRTLKDRVREAFTPSGAKEKWYRNHQEIVKQYSDVNNGLTEEQRAQAMAQIESDATRSSKIAVGGHWAALAAGTATLALGAVGIAKPGLVDSLAGKLRNVNIKGKNFGMAKVGEGLSSVAHSSHDFLASIPLRAVMLKNMAVEKGKATWEAVAGKLRKKPVITMTEAS